MDIAYDQVSSPLSDNTTTRPPNSTNTPDSPTANTLPTEFAQAISTISSSPWGAKLGGWISQARKQGETLIQNAEQEATKGWSSLAEQVSRTRGMSLEGGAAVPGEETLPGAEKEKEGEEAKERSENLPADIVKEASSVFANLRVTAAARLKDLQKAEDAADEALLKFGLGVRDFLRDAVVVTAPDSEQKGGEVLFETQEAGTGKKVFHTTRLDAQLHAIHTSPANFVEEPKGEEWEQWKEGFDVEGKTEMIAGDLERFPELRGAMEKVVPEKVEYGEFWTRYYWLRWAVEEDERRRREVLKGATASPEEEVGWDDDDEEDESSTPKTGNESTTAHKASQSTTTLTAPLRKSEDESRSVADSEASYDIVSGATSRATSSPKTKEVEVGKEKEKEKGEESDDDWE